MRYFNHLLVLFLLCLFLPSLKAQSSPEMTPAVDPFFTDLVGNLSYVEQEVVSLAQEMPQDKYSWRPMEGVRSVSEVYMHIALSNYFILTFVGGKMPESLKPNSENEDLEKTITNKEEIINKLKDSYKYAKDFISKMKMSDLDKEVTFFGNKTDYRGMLFILMGHSHEHLGQSIAYARTNGVTPPWSKKDK